MKSFREFLEDAGTDLGGGGPSPGVHRSEDIVFTMHGTHHHKHKKKHHAIAYRTAGGHWLSGYGGYLGGGFARSCENCYQNHCQNNPPPSGGAPAGGSMSGGAGGVSTGGGGAPAGGAGGA